MFCDVLNPENPLILPLAPSEEAEAEAEAEEVALEGDAKAETTRDRSTQ